MLCDPGTVPRPRPTWTCPPSSRAPGPSVTRPLWTGPVEAHPGVVREQYGHVSIYNGILIYILGTVASRKSSRRISFGAHDSPVVNDDIGKTRINNMRSFMCPRLFPQQLMVTTDEADSRSLDEEEAVRQRRQRAAKRAHSKRVHNAITCLICMKEYVNPKVI